MVKTVMLIEQSFYYVRHGETAYNKEDRLQGLLDIPLNDTGIAQAHAAKRLFEGVEIGSVVCSPLIRARRTAEIICEVLDKPITIIHELHECNLGVQDGDPRGQWYDDWKAGHLTIDGAETHDDLLTRSLKAINRALAENPGPVLIVAHGGVYKTVLPHTGLHRDYRLPNCLPLLHRPPQGEDGTWRVTDMASGQDLERVS